MRVVIVPTHIDSDNTTQFDMTVGDTDQEDVRSEGATPEDMPMACERPRRRRLVFPLSSGFENLEGLEDEDGDDRDGASEGPEEDAADVTPLEVAEQLSPGHQECSGTVQECRGGGERSVVGGWKLFLLLPRMLLHRPPRGRLQSQSWWRDSRSSTKANGSS